MYHKPSVNARMFLVKVQPKFQCIICGLWSDVIKDPETNIYIVPITALKP